MYIVGLYIIAINGGVKITIIVSHDKNENMPSQPRGLFINTAKANCSIYESGRMMYTCLLLSDKYKLDYVEIDENDRNISDKYDFYVFNYHYFTMQWLDTTILSQLPGVVITFVLEMLPNNPFIMCPSEDFDAYCVLDPTMNVADKRVYSFPRPLEVPHNLMPYHEGMIPVIGSFGLTTTDKGFELIIDAVNHEFDEAIIRINIPHGTYITTDFSECLRELRNRNKKDRIKIVITHDYMTKEELINWCGQNTLNCFLYTRDIQGLAATTDQAISSGRPLAISDNNTFRHISPYIKPYPYRNLKESIALSQAEVLQIQQDWAPEKFTKRFEQVLNDLCLFSSPPKERIDEKMIELKCKQPPRWYNVMLHNLVNKFKFH